MDSLGFMTEIVHKQKQHDFMEEAKVDRFLQEKKDKEVDSWMQRRFRRNRRSK